jgi:zeta-carotene desaturase
MEEPFLTLLDRTTQWIFNKTLLYEGASEAKAGQASAGQHLQLVISASYDLVQKSRAEIIDLCCAELSEVLPATREAQLVKSTVIKEVHATFSPEPGCDRWRPRQRASIPGLFLAGDWTATGWPATMEGAVRSGYLAAEEILRAEGRPFNLLRPELPAEGLARFWSRE